MTDEGEPGRTAVAGTGPIVSSEDTSHDILVNLYAEGLGDDQGDPWASEPGIALLELDDRPDQRWR